MRSTAIQYVQDLIEQSGDKLPPGKFRRFIEGEFTNGEKPMSLPGVRENELKRILFVMDVIESMGTSRDPSANEDGRKTRHRSLRHALPLEA